MALIISLVLVGCATFPVALAPSSRPITANDTVTEIGPASGSAFGGIVFGIPFGELRQVGPALQRALKSSGGDALIEVAVEYKTYNLLIGTLMRTSVYGTAVKIQKGGATR
jgi:hypothetical protein